MPGWFLAYLGVMALFFSFEGCRALLGGIRAAAALESGPRVRIVGETTADDADVVAYRKALEDINAAQVVGR